MLSSPDYALRGKLRSGRGVRMEESAYLSVLFWWCILASALARF